MKPGIKSKPLIFGIVPLLVLTLVLGGCDPRSAVADDQPLVNGNTEIENNSNPSMPPLDDHTTSIQLELSYEELLAQKHIMGDVTLEIPGSIIIILGSNPSTGFTWSEPSSSNSSVLSEYSRQFVEPVSGLIGAAGKDVWTFKSQKTGDTTLRFEYCRSGQLEWTLTLNISVK